MIGDIDMEERLFILGGIIDIEVCEAKQSRLESSFSQPFWSTHYRRRSFAESFVRSFLSSLFFSTLSVHLRSLYYVNHYMHLFVSHTSS